MCNAKSAFFNSASGSTSYALEEAKGTKSHSYYYSHGSFICHWLLCRIVRYSWEQSILHLLGFCQRMLWRIGKVLVPFYTSKPTSWLIQHLISILLSFSFMWLGDGQVLGSDVHLLEHIHKEKHCAWWNKRKRDSLLLSYDSFHGMFVIFSFIY